jgi:hypothetical protein
MKKRRERDIGSGKKRKEDVKKERGNEKRKS